MQDSRTGRERDLFAFHDPRMETAFVQHIGKHTRLSSELLRAVRFAGWTMLVARLLLQTRAVGGSADYATAAIVLTIYLVTSLEDVCMLRALRAQPPVLHECRKSANVLRFMVGRMAVAVLMTPTSLPFTSAPAIALLTGIDMVSDCVRLCVGLRMLALSCLACLCTLMGQVKGSPAPVTSAVGGTALIAFSGFLLPAAALACLELRSRLVFIGMHPPGAQKQLAPRWHAFAEALQWQLPFATAPQQPQQQQQPCPQPHPVRTSLPVPPAATKQPDRRRAPSRCQQAESPVSVLDMRF